MLCRVTWMGTSLALLLSCTFSLAGCDSGEGVGSQYSITGNEAAIIVGSGFGSRSSTYGLAGQIEELAGLANGLPTAPDSITVAKVKTGVPGYGYSLHCVFGLAGNEFEATYDMKGTYETPGMASRDTVYGELRFSNLSGDTLLVHGYSWRFGRQDFTQGERNTYISDVLSTMDNIRYSRAAESVVGGTVTFTLREIFPDGVVVSLPGTCTFLGNHQAVLVVHRTTSRIDLDTGVIAPA